MSFIQNYIEWVKCVYKNDGLIFFQILHLIIVILVKFIFFSLLLLILRTQ